MRQKERVKISRKYKEGVMKRGSIFNNMGKTYKKKVDNGRIDRDGEVTRRKWLLSRKKKII